MDANARRERRELAVRRVANFGEDARRAAEEAALTRSERDARIRQAASELVNEATSRYRDGRDGVSDPRMILKWEEQGTNAVLAPLVRQLDEQIKQLLPRGTSYRLTQEKVFHGPQDGHCCRLRITKLGHRAR